MQTSSYARKFILLLIALFLIIAAYFIGRAHGKSIAVQSSETTTSTSTIENFISNTPLTAPQFGGKMFVAYKILGETAEGKGKIIYAWAFVQEYYKENGTLRSGSGVSIPLAIHTKLVGSIYLPTSYETPRSGNLFTSDVAAQFPKNIQDIIYGKNTKDKNSLVSSLGTQTAASAKTYFGL